MHFYERGSRRLLLTSPCKSLKNSKLIDGVKSADLCRILRGKLQQIRARQYSLNEDAVAVVAQMVLSRPEFSCLENVSTSAGSEAFRRSKCGLSSRSHRSPRYRGFLHIVANLFRGVVSQRCLFRSDACFASFASGSVSSARGMRTLHTLQILAESADAVLNRPLPKVIMYRFHTTQH